MIEENVIAQLDHLATHPSVAAKRRTGALLLLGLVYDIPHGEFRVYDAQRLRFVPLSALASVVEAEEPQAVSA